MIKRTRHVVTEIKRTIDAAEALEKGDIKKFGQLMNESHDSLKNDYEVSSVELDTLVKAAREINGVLGSRLTGAGFGGCTVTLLRKDVIDQTINHMKTKLDCYFCNIFIIFEFDNDIYIQYIVTDILEMQHFIQQNLQWVQEFQTKIKEYDNKKLLSNCSIFTNKMDIIIKKKTQILFLYLYQTKIFLI